MSPAPDGASALAVHGVSKSFGSTHALRDVSLDLRAGEIHSLVGENGAGKSTLIKVMSGLVTPDSGTITAGGEPVELHGPADAQTLGISCIYQEPQVFPDLTVSENIFMGTAGSGRLVRWRELHRRAARDPRPARGRRRSRAPWPQG